MAIIVERIEDGKRIRTRRNSIPPMPLDQHRQELAEAHVRLGYARAHAQARKGMDIAEALSVAMGAVVEAASRYDEAKGIPFPVYCDLVVRSKLVDAAARDARHAAHHTRQAEERQDDGTPDTHEPDPGRAAAVKEMVERLRRALPAEVFQLLWDVFAEGRSMAEAGRERDVSRQRAHQVVARGLAKAQRICDRWADHCPAE